MEKLSFLIDWLNPDPAEKKLLLSSTMADFGLRGMGKDFFSHLNSLDGGKRVQSRLQTSLYLVGDWLSEHFWRMAYEPAKGYDLAESSYDWLRAHCMVSIGRGYCWPHLFFYGDGDSVTAELKNFPKESVIPLHFIEEGSVQISHQEFFTLVLEFLGKIQERLKSQKLSDEGFSLDLKSLIEEWKDIDFHQYRRLEACMGLGIDENPDFVGSVLSLFDESSRLEDVCEIVSDVNLDSSGLAQLQDTFQILRDKANCDVSVLKNWDTSGAKPSIHTAYQWARILREKLDIDSGAVSEKHFSDLLQLQVGKGLEKLPENACFGMGEFQPDGKGSLVLTKKHPSSKRFQLARLIGDFVMSHQDSSLHIAGETYSMRQKMQRAFAAEFLCPAAELESSYDPRNREDFISSKAIEYSVSELVIQHQVDNSF